MGFSNETHEKVERAFAFLTGNHFINYHYGASLSAVLKVLPLKDFDAQEIVPNLFLGDVYAAHNTQELKNRKFTHILTCTVGVTPPFPDSFKYLHLKILDCAAETIHEHFAETSAFIAEAIASGGKVLVHCIRGVSRSATIVTAYLMTSLMISAEEAVQRVQAVRPIARPNYGFMIQLQMYAKELQKSNTLQITVSEDQDLPMAEWGSSP
eukprot:Phypoly_transcript_18717.p1 GENE.Phypoly_transcript_18717~~Phypoly_transcript_18717.p1  ORF type:complete len:210 (+),score=33.86 Phypoly_transcript_18717:110-739(+)